MQKASKIELPRSKIDTATLEAIYWWNRTEGYYHQYFSRLNELHSDDKLFAFFVKKVFEVFLNDYSVRRNIASGPENVHKFVNELMVSEYFLRVKDGDHQVIDDISDHLRETSDLVNGRHTRSLLSKAAFLINPYGFSLADTYARDSLWSLINKQRRVTRKSLDSYSIFISEIDEILLVNNSAFHNIDSHLSQFKGSLAYRHFDNSPSAFRRRVFDKLLWINRIDQNESQIVNGAYPRFYTFVTEN